MLNPELQFSTHWRLSPPCGMEALVAPSDPSNRTPEFDTQRESHPGGRRNIPSPRRLRPGKQKQWPRPPAFHIRPAKSPSESCLCKSHFKPSGASKWNEATEGNQTEKGRQLCEVARLLSGGGRPWSGENRTARTLTFTVLNEDARRARRASAECIEQKQCVRLCIVNTQQLAG